MANLTEKAVAFYKDDTTIYEMFKTIVDNDTDKSKITTVDTNTKQERMHSISADKSATYMNNKKPSNKEVTTVNKTIDLYDDDAVNRDFTER